MKIEQKKVFEPVVLTLETEAEFSDFVSILGEAKDKTVKIYVEGNASKMLDDLLK